MTPAFMPVFVYKLIIKEVKMTNLLDEVKNRLLISGDFHNALILGFIEDVKQYMVSAGVDETVVNSKKAIGCISRGVNDLFNNENFSNFFNQRVIQLSMEEPTEEEPIPVLPPAEEPEDNTEPSDPSVEPDNPGEDNTDPDDPNVEPEPDEGDINDGI